MTTVYDQYEQLTEPEQAYLRRHPHHVLTINDARTAAFAETVRRFGKNGHNDKSDAFRHCFWSALLARDVGFNNGLAFTTAHESFSGNKMDEKRMDLHNNRVGLNIGRQGGSNSTLSDRCMSALRAGKLQVIVQ